jgi:hypothetical protein
MPFPQTEPAVGFAVGLSVGWAVGLDVGTAVGLDVGAAVGLDVGTAVGLAVGADVGLAVGAEVGAFEGLVVGPAVGLAMGALVLGANDGGFVGNLVGDMLLLVGAIEGRVQPIIIILIDFPFFPTQTPPFRSAPMAPMALKALEWRA